MPGTCEWILVNPHYTEWAATERSQLLCVLGTAGIGKTMIASYLVDQIEARAKRSPSTLFLYFFCDNKDETRRKSKEVLRSLLIQLLQQQPSFFEHVQPEYDKMGDQLRNNFNSLRNIFLAILLDPKASSMFILIDALDECENDSKMEIAEMFCELFKEGLEKQSVKVLITHRPEYATNWPLKDTRLQLRIDLGTINADLKKYIVVKVEEFMTKIKDLKPKPGTENEIRKSLIGKAGGTFLWISLVLDFMSNSKSLGQLRQKLSKLPPDLEAVYERILQQIDQDERETAAFILHIVCIARRPLTVRELAAAYLLGPGNYEQTAAPTYDDLSECESEYKCCGAFLQLDEETQVISLVHQSAKDFLQDSLALEQPLHQHYAFFYPHPSKTNLLMFQICWRYLSMKEFKDGNMIVIRAPDNRLVLQDLSKKSLQAFSFLQYASKEWEEHAIAAQSALVAQNGFERISLDQLPTLRDVWLLRAAEEGQEAVVRLLLEHKADAKAKMYGRTALQVASVNGHGAVVRLLLEHGADVTAAVGLHKSTALHLAAEGGHEEVVQQLLEHGADVNAVEDKVVGGTALHLAAKGGHEEVVRLLLEHGSDLKAENRYGRRTALHLAARGGHEEVVRLLLEHGADVKTRDGYGGTALHLAAESGQEEVVRLLLEHGVDIKEKDELGGTPLHWAAKGGRVEMVRLLLEEHKADVNAEEMYGGGTSLHQAAYYGREEVVRLLLEHKANAKAKMYGRTALQVASVNGHEAVVQLLQSATHN